MKKIIVAFSNPFGYGPTGILIPVLKELAARTKDVRIIFAGSGICLEILSGLAIETVVLDERSEEEICAYLKTISNAYIIGSQNRFCIRAAKKLKMPCAFIDVLAWFWNEIPSDHFLADEIFWINFPGIESRLNREAVHIVSSIITTYPSLQKNKKLIIHIGGAKYPLMDHPPLHYFNLLIKALNNLSVADHFDSVLLVAGSEAIAYMKPQISNHNVTLATLPKEDFIHESSHASHMLTTAGVSSTLESFSMDIPTSFLLPLNLSQIALAGLLKEQGSYLQGLEWDNYVDVNKELRQMNEREALIEIDSYAKLVDEDKHLSDKFVRDFSNMAKTIPDNSKQKKLIEYMGDSGDKEIADILIKKWHLA